jgi:hypothetical protein
VTGVLTVIYVVGKSIGPGALSEAGPAYKPVLTVGRFLDNNAHFARELLYLDEDPGKLGILTIWALIAYLVFRRRRTSLRWAFVLIVAGGLPIAFIAPRGGSWLNIPLFGFALVAATVLADVARFVSGEPLFRRMGGRGLVRVAVCLAFMSWHGWFLYRWQRADEPYWVESQNRTWTEITEMQRVRPRIARGSRIAILNDPGLGWEMYFVAQLALRDPGAKITQQKTYDHILTPEEIAGYDHVLTFDDNTVLHVLK